MYVFLGSVIVLGLVNTLVANVFGEYDYRESVSVWFRGIFRFSLKPELMAAAPIGFKLHAPVAFSLLALPSLFTRLVHVFSAPLGTSPVPTSSTAAVMTSLAAAPPAGAGRRSNNP